MGFIFPKAVVYEWKGSVAIEAVSATSKWLWALTKKLVGWKTNAYMRKLKQNENDYSWKQRTRWSAAVVDPSALARKIHQKAARGLAINIEEQI